MKKLLLFSFTFLSLFSIAQPYGNEWIDYDPDRRYLKLYIGSNGIYRIDSATLGFALQSIGENLNDVDPRSLQVFARGEEQYIYVEGESDGEFNPGDFIEFYGERNDGTLDETLYPSADQHTNPYYSLYSDSLAYFITWYPDGSPSNRRIQSIPYNSPVSSTFNYFFAEKRSVYSGSYQTGEKLTSGKVYPFYTGGKGWMSGRFGYPQNPSSIGFNPGISQLYIQGNAPNAQLEVAIAGVNRGAGDGNGPDHHVQLRMKNGGNTTVLENFLFESYEYFRNTTQIDVSNLSSNTSFDVYAGLDVSQLSTAVDYSSIAYFKFTYPHILNFENKEEWKFEIPASSIERHFNASNFSTNAASFMYDLKDHKRYQVLHQNNGQVRTNILAGDQREFYICTDIKIQNLSSFEIKPVNEDGVFNDPSDWYADSAYLMITNQKLWSSATAYRNYRASTHNAVLLDIDELYDQFAYGVKRHPLSIRGMVDYALNEWPTPPAYLFLIGKSISEDEFKKSNGNAQNVLVPTIGYPATDNLLTSELEGTKGEPAIPTGRISARSNGELNAYLQKVRELEIAQVENSSNYSIPNKAWQKRILHFAGGSDAKENERLEGYLESFGNIAKTPNFGAEVHMFSKTSSNVIQQLNTDSVRNLLRDGTAVITFFGHSSGNNFDISVDDPSDWNNTGRYPFVIANSCYSGNIHLPIQSVASTSEDYVLTPNEGSIAFIATPDESFEQELNLYTRNLYQLFSSEMYGKTIGQQMKQAAFQTQSGDDKRWQSVALEFSLHGDPALKIYSHSKAELVINDYTEGPQIEFSPKLITTEVDSFNLIVNLRNIGRATDTPFSLKVTRTLPNGEAQPAVLKQIAGASNLEQIPFRFAVNSEQGVGINQFRVEVDLESQSVPEYDDFNNNLVSQVDQQILSSEIFPVYPYDFAVVPSLNMSLKANTGSPFLPEFTYTFQIDTTDTYDSPFFDSVDITQEGALLEWDPNLDRAVFEDSTVFFWRVSQKDSNKWREFSFQYIPNQYGWGQDHFFQYKENEFNFLEHNRDKRKFEFAEGNRELKVNVIGNTNPGNFLEAALNEYRIDGKLAPFGEYGIIKEFPGMAIAVIDSANLMPWGCYGYNNQTGRYENNDRKFGNNNSAEFPGDPRIRVEYFFTFLIGSETQMDSMISMITNKVEDGHYILAYTQINGNFDHPHWTPQRFAAFEALGADSISLVPNDHPYIFLVKKGDPSTAIEVIGKDRREEIKLNTILTTSVTQGTMTSEPIGPARAWEELSWRSSDKDVPKTDVDSIQLIGLTSEGIENRLRTLSSSSLGTDISDINADDYPYLKLKYFTHDKTNLTSGNLKHWHLFFEPVPDVALNPVKGFVVPNDEFSAGQSLDFGITLENYTDFDFDTLSVDYWISDGSGQRVAETTRWISGPLANTERLDTVQFNSGSLAGNYTLWMEANPKGERWQTEQYDFNNIGFRSFSVKADKTNPLLDVTFDGVHIVNGDIVAPQPEIVMQLNDENEILLLSDTSLLDVFITQPNGMERRVPYVSGGREIMVFDAATDAKNKATITYKPDQALSDGTYKLRIEGRDASGNSIGDRGFNIEFEVINRSMITKVMNYPNPFSTSTRFVFTLTGSEVPDVFTIQILTVTGKVIREITKDELGPIKIGRNMTEYAWDGRDEFGDRLGNGVYLYRVITKINGEGIENMSTDADSYFKEGFGKMYLFR